MTAKAEGESPVLRDPSCVETLSRDRFKGLHFAAYAVLSQLSAPASVGAWAENVRSPQGALRASFIGG